MANAKVEHQRVHHGHQIIPIKTLLVVFGGLVILTIVTVLTAQIDLGVLNVPLALLIASTKAFLVVSFFMALRYDNKVNTMVFAFGVIFVIVFMANTLFDTEFRGDIGNVDPQTISDRVRIEEEMRARDPGAQGQQSGAEPGATEGQAGPPGDVATEGDTPAVPPTEGNPAEENEGN